MRPITLVTVDRTRRGSVVDHGYTGGFQVPDSPRRPVKMHTGPTDKLNVLEDTDGALPPTTPYALGCGIEHPISALSRW